MKRILFVSALGAVLAACGGGGGGSSGPKFANPDDAHFTYGTPTSASGATTTAATTGESGTDSTVALTQASDANSSWSVVNLPDTMAGSVFQTTTPAVRAAATNAREEMSQRALAYAAGDLATATNGFDNPNCVTITEMTVAFAQCTKTITDTEYTATLTVNGSLARALAEVNWDVTVAEAMTVHSQNGDINVAVSLHLTGRIAVSEISADYWNVKGFARDDTSAKASGQGQSVSLAFTHNVDLDLNYQRQPAACIVSGTLELKRVWAERPSGSTATEYPDVAIKFEWTACGSVQVSWGTL